MFMRVSSMLAFKDTIDQLGIIQVVIRLLIDVARAPKWPSAESVTC
jgi:hypothetical protein